MNYKDAVLLSLIDDPDGLLPKIAQPDCTVVQAPPELVSKFTDYIVQSRSYHRVIKGYTELYRDIVELERNYFQGQENRRKFSGVIMRNRNINNAAMWYFTTELKADSYGLVFMEQKRLETGTGAPRYVPNYFITFDFT